MHTEIKKWGNSAVVRLPATLLSELGLRVGSPIELRQEQGHLVIEPARHLRQGWFDSAISEEENLFDSIPADEGGDEWHW